MFAWLLSGSLLLFALAARAGGKTADDGDTGRQEVLIEAPAAFVYPYVTSGDMIARWSRDDRLEISFPQGTDARVGMQIHFRIRFPTHPAWTVEITALEKDREMHTAITEGIFRGGISFFLEPDGAKKTRLIHRAKVLPQGRFMQFAWQTAGREIHRRKMEEILQRIKGIVEADYRASRAR